jgi:hypothetical protein
MNSFDVVIQELRGIRQEVQKVNALPCRCSAYKFPHRIGSGKCGDTMPAQNVPYHHSRDAMNDAGMSAKDFK